MSKEKQIKEQNLADVAGGGEFDGLFKQWYEANENLIHAMPTEENHNISEMLTPEDRRILENWKPNTEPSPGLSEHGRSVWVNN